MEEGPLSAAAGNAAAAASETPPERTLPIILVAAVVQGWALYGLHRSIEGHFWPATDWGWLIALYALAIFVPATVQILADHVRGRAPWPMILLLAACYFYFGMHAGNAVFIPTSGHVRVPEDYLALALLLIILWLLAALPFVQSRLAFGNWQIHYATLFADAWRNKLALAEAALFTGLLWLLLFLWQMLFHMLGIDFFRELFEKPVFIYPVTSLAFGCALHLVGSIERLTSAILEQLLNVLKWLALVAGLLLAFSTIALVFKLPNLVFTGQRAIGAAWLLWLVAVAVLLLNAAYRDGSVTTPYPKGVALFLRAIVPLMIVIALTALYALIMRSRDYGLTVDRVWAFVVAGAALAYSVGYSISAFGRGPWLRSIAPVNVVVALALIAVIAAALTPLLSPQRLAANSQYERVLRQGFVAARGSGEAHYSGVVFVNGALRYLRFHSGRYGLRKLQQLASTSANGKDAQKVRDLAKETLAMETPWGTTPRNLDVHDRLAHIKIYPADRTLPDALIAVLTGDLAQPSNDLSSNGTAKETAGVFVDLNGDRSDEFVLMAARHGLVYEKQNGQWRLMGDLSLIADSAGCDFDLAGELSKASVHAAQPKWSDLIIGTAVFRISERAGSRPHLSVCPQTGAAVKMAR